MFIVHQTKLSKILCFVITTGIPSAQASRSLIGILELVVDILTLGMTSTSKTESNARFFSSSS